MAQDRVLPEPNFLSRERVKEWVEILADKYPRVFFQDRLQVVGVDVPPAEILNAEGEVVEPKGGRWELGRGTYQVKFGFEFPEGLQRSKIRPQMFWRSSNHRLGCGGRSFFAGTYEKLEDDLLFGAEVVAFYGVWNPYGVVIEQGASLAQVCFTEHGGQSIPIFVSDLLVPAWVGEFLGPGTIGRNITKIPETKEISVIGDKRILKKGVPYLIEFKGRVTLDSDEVLVPITHYGDELKNPKLENLLQYSCLGDPGYKGRLGMLVVPALDEILGIGTGLARVAKFKVIPLGEMAEYAGQWQGGGEDVKEPEIEFPLFFRGYFG